MDAARARKLADRISQIVAEMLERRIKDPRLGFVRTTVRRIRTAQWAILPSVSVVERG